MGKSYCCVSFVLLPVYNKNKTWINGFFISDSRLKVVVIVIKTSVLDFRLNVNSLNTDIISL